MTLCYHILVAGPVSYHRGPGKGKIKMKKTLSIILDLLMLLSAVSLASCGAPAQPEDTTAPAAVVGGDDTVAETEDESVKSAKLPDTLNYNGETIVVISRNAAGVNDEFKADEVIGDIITDTVYSRNQKVEKRLGIKLDAQLTPTNDAYTITNSLLASLSSGDHLYDFVSNSTYSTVDQTVQGILRNLKNCEYLDLDASYWSQGFNNAITIGGKQYLATGAISLSMYRYMFVTFFNVDMFKSASEQSLFDVVNSGKWTIDYQIRLLDVFYQDKNGNGSSDSDDVFGFATNYLSYIDPYWSACKLPVVNKDADDLFEVALDIERISTAVDKIIELYHKHNTFIGPKEGSDPGFQASMTKIFSEDRAATATMRILSVESNDMKNMESEYGIIPMPKLDEDQDGYYTFMHDQLSSVGIPSTVVSDDRFQMIGAVLEALAVESANTLVPAYYEVALKGRFLRNSQSVQMLDLIYDSVKIDGGFMYSRSLGSIQPTLREMIESKQNTSSSRFKAVAKTLGMQIKKLHEGFAGLPGT